MNKRTLAGAAIAFGALVIARMRSSGGSGSGPALSVPMPKQVYSVPFAMGSPAPTWPVLTSSPERYVVSYVDTDGKTHGNAQRDFGEFRNDPDGDRRHVGVDLYGYENDPVVAAESGTVVRVRPTFNLGTGILYLATDTGITLAYGEIAPYSWKDFGITEGMRVARGQKLARVGCQVHEGSTCKSHMIHFETYRGRVTKNESWGYSKPPPPGVLNPTLYLLRARQAAGVA